MARLGEDLVVGCFDAVEDLGVEGGRGGDRRADPGGEQGDAGHGLPVDVAVDGDRGEPARGAGGRVGAAAMVAGAQVGFVDAEGPQFVGGQVDAVAVEVFADVAQEIGELEGLAERGGCGFGLARRGTTVPRTGSSCRPIAAADPRMYSRSSRHRGVAGAVGGRAGHVHAHRRRGTSRSGSCAMS